MVALGEWGYIYGLRVVMVVLPHNFLEWIRHVLRRHMRSGFLCNPLLSHRSLSLLRHFYQILLSILPCPLLRHFGEEEGGGAGGGC